ncbi:Glutamate receptor, ionotropic kainate 2 [Eufriesea mexicana]|uniref:Glutamate receptor 1 n=1 Tax=Eufriesea mexicana TaxID=516756 RepID=A0A310SIT8_9HYME|nr:Glutamate receptor, ionotropic kainate 2 [Eufriesea mexicana]
MAAFEKAVEEAKFEHVAPAFELDPVIIKVKVNTDSFRTAVAACQLLDQGVAAIFGPSSPSTYGIVASIAARYDVPHIDYFWRLNEELQADQEPKNPKPMTINVFPDSDMVGQPAHAARICAGALALIHALLHLHYCICVVTSPRFRCRTYTVTPRVCNVALPLCHPVYRGRTVAFPPLQLRRCADDRDDRRRLNDRLPVSLAPSEVTLTLLKVRASSIDENRENVFQAIADVAVSMKWNTFAAVYQNNDGLSRIQKALSMRRKKDSVITIRRLGDGPDYRSVLKEIRSLSICNVIVDVEPNNIIEVLYQAKEVKLLADYCNFLITYLDSTKIPMWEVRNKTTTNITGLSLRENDVEGINWVESAVLYDAVFLVYNALEALNARNKDSNASVTIDPVPLSCENEEKYSAGPNITNLMRELSNQGKITGPITIDENGRRQFFNVRIMDVREGESVQTGYWDPDGLHSIDSEQERENYLYKSIEQKKFKISTKLGPPYVMEVTDSATRGILIEQTRYEGFCIDLIEEIAKLLNFKYEFELVPDGKYGTYDKETKQWNGLIRRLLDRDADLAICDLTITYERESAVDFTMPFMNLGISILSRKPEEKEPDLFSFLSPLSTDVWIYMATAFLAVSIMLFLQARMAPGEWDNPHPCNPDPEELENSFDLKNSMWLTVGSIMQQGSDILPKAPSIRMVAGMWWFFTLIMVSSYTANLAAFLTVDKMDNPIKGVEDLAKQTKVKYGAVDGGSTSAFFRDSNYSTYQRMWAAMMEARPSVFTKSNDEGVDRVLKKRDYAFLMESTTIEYRMERNCDLDKVGGLIDNKGYGIALPRNSPYRTPISGAILMLQEKGLLQDLKKKWWEERGGGLCSKVDQEPTVSSELGLANVGGVFLVLLIGCCGSFVIAVFEFLWNVRKVAVKEKVTPLEALVAELKFAVNIWAETKPVKISKSSGTSSMEGGIGRAASTARSIVGSFLHLDILDKFDKDNSTNNRSDDRKIN